MATPDLQSLYELYRQLYGGQIESSQSPQPDRETQNHKAAGVSGNYMPPGAALSHLRAPPAAVLAGMQSSMPVGMGFRAPLPGTRFRFGNDVPMHGGSGPVPGSPNPHLESLIPNWMRSFWAAGTLLPKIIASDISGRGGADSRTQGGDVLPSSQPQSEKREDRSGGVGWYVGPNPSTRILQRVDDEAAGEKEVLSPPLAPDAVDEEACAEEWANARRDCEAGFRGPRGQGPTSIPKGRRGRNYTVEDCARGIVSSICGGEPLKEGRTGAQAAKGNNKAIRQQRKNRGQL